MRKRQVLSTAGEKLPAMGPGARHQAWDFLRILILVDGKAGHQLAAVILQLRLELSAGAKATATARVKGNPVADLAGSAVRRSA